MPRTYVVQQGDCLASIAYANGFAIDTIWNDAANAALRQQRATPFQLVTGDEVTIPDLIPKQLTRRTTQRHVFRRRNVPEMVKIQLHDAQKQPRANLPYVLIIDGNRVEGTTDAEGRLQQAILPSVRSAQLLISADEEYELATGYLLPETEAGGVHARLAALGYLNAQGEGEDEVILSGALTRFQTDESLTVTGSIDDLTRAKLVERYGS